MQALPTTDAPKMSPVLSSKLSTLLGEGTFTGTDVYGNYHQTIPTRNFGRVHGGFKGGHAKFDWALVYTGLFGSHFMENSASLKLERKF